ncbi:MAG: flagellar filament capping protein FliD [Proteobacteria bacterium]|nr:flagellar filament capping protein FliD [Pseudomonadota bacterium]
MAIAATTGLMSGIDYGTLISQLVGLQRKPIEDLEYDRDQLDKLSSTYDTLDSLVKTLRDAGEAFNETADLNVFTSSSTDETILTASSGSTAGAGTYDLVVTSLAKSHKMIATGVATSTSTISSVTGTFVFNVGTGADQTVNVTATTTLEELRDAINALGSGATASILNDGDPSNPYRLTIKSDTTGTSSDITVVTNDTDLTISTLQGSANAAFTVDTLSISSESNTVTDVIDGVTLNLLSADAATTVNVTIARDAGSVRAKVQDILDAYNAVAEYIEENNRYNTDTKISEPLFGEAIARSIKDDIKAVMMSEVTGLDSTMNRLVHAGISVDIYGKFSLDSTTFDNALTTDFQNLRNLFVEDSTAYKGFGGLIQDIADEITSYSDGRIKEKQDGISSTIASIDYTTRNKELQLAAYESRIRGEFTALELLLAGMKQQSSYLSTLLG